MSNYESIRKTIEAEEGRDSYDHIGNYNRIGSYACTVNVRGVIRTFIPKKEGK